MMGVANDAITIVEFYIQLFFIVSELHCLLDKLIIGCFELFSNAIDLS